MTEEKSSQSVYVDNKLWQEAKLKAGEAGVSLIVAKLLRMWLSGQVVPTLEPMKGNDK